MKKKWLEAFPWILGSIVSALAIYVWGQSFSWEFSAISPYQFFPVLGLLAYSLMWTHYVTGTVRDYFLKNADLRAYFRYTGYVVLAAIVLHPGILIYSLFRDGFGLPPGSYEHYVMPGLAWVTLLGTASLLVFLAFEFRRWYAQKAWWKYVASASDAAMLAIFYHGLRLGTQLHGGWFRGVWWFYGLTLVAILVRKYTLIALGKQKAEATTTEW
jgi:hypothetical protein